MDRLDGRRQLTSPGYDDDRQLTTKGRFVMLDRKNYTHEDLEHANVDRARQSGYVVREMRSQDAAGIAGVHV